MTRRGRIVARFAVATAFVACRSARAQPNLPPPPPPPIGGEHDVPALPPPPPPSSDSQATPSPSATPPSRRPAPGTATPRPRPRRPEARPEPSPSTTEAPALPAHPLAVTWNPLGLVWGRLSVNVEWRLAPHHSLVASPNALIFQADRGSARDLLSEGFGFASPSSFGAGVEVGYHYWLAGDVSLRGWFVGPSFLSGFTTEASVGDPAHPQGYWGVALDAGAQEVLANGFTAGVGAGIAVLGMEGVTALVPRALLQLGWQF